MERQPLVHGIGERNPLWDAPGVVLCAGSSAAPTDFLVRLGDASPEGSSLNVTDGLCRLSPPERAHADGQGALPIDLWPTAYCFQAGRQIRLLVMSGGPPIAAEAGARLRRALRPARNGHDGMLALQPIGGHSKEDTP
jgi:predicted acyl esterase